MRAIRSVLIFVSGLWFSTAIGVTPVYGQATPSERLTPWRASRVKGSPEPPLPYQATRVFANVDLDRPTDVMWLPSANRWIATQVNGKIVSFANDPQNAVAEPVLDLNDVVELNVRNAYATMFHHDLENEPWCYVTYSAGPKDPLGTHLARLTVTDPTVPKIDPNSLVVMASWNSEGHSGGSMQFGPDGMFYVSVGDGQNPYPPDADDTGQDLSDLEASVLRLDVDRPTEGKPYRIPSDNPFVGQPGVREEIWAFGFRNPWKIAFDPDSGDLLAADVGWEMREIIHRVDKGRNHGWSLMEGSQSVKQGRAPEIPITPPLFEHTHIDSRSISGGHFWQSDRIPELKGAYVYGDWMTGKVWALKSSGDKVLWQKELVDTPQRVIGFMIGPDGEVLIVGYDGILLRIDPNPQSQDPIEFPTRLSETGLFADVARQIPEPGVIEYQISAAHWADGTHARQWIAVPGTEQVGLYKNDDWKTGQTTGRFEFPPDTVVAKTVSYYRDREDMSSLRHIETQLLHLLGDEWRAYNYVWNDDQTDAILQDDIAVERKLTIRDPDAPDGMRTQTWRHASRSECLLCHIWAAGTVHAFWPEQLSIDSLNPSGEIENQLDRLTALGLFADSVPVKQPLASPDDATRSLEDRARSYLALNCSTCHRPQGGGTANFNFDLTKSLEQNNYIDAVPAQGTFGIDDARVVAPGEPFRSVLLYRALKSGRGHMPQFGSNVIDHRGIELLRDWIESMPAEPAEQRAAEVNLDSLRGLAADSRDDQLSEWLASARTAMELSLCCSELPAGSELKEQIVRAGAAREDSVIRDLFEHYLPEDQRVKRLGPTVDADALLAIEGSAERGEALFVSAKDVNCRSCHRIGEVGENIGPDLSGIGTQQTPGEILNSIVDPSRTIAREYRARQILTADGDVLVGIVLKESEQEITLADSSGKRLTVKADDIEVMQPAAKSAMPDQLLSGMTAQRAADLLAYLGAQRKIGPLQHKRYSIHYTDRPIRIDGKRDDPQWATAESVGDFVFTWSSEGDGPRQPTDAKMLWDDRYLYVCFSCTDADIQATRTERDSPVYRDDCVEVFASPEFEKPENYFNLEMNALGAQLDNYRPGGQEPESPWDPDGIRLAVTRQGTLNDSSDTDSGWDLEVAIPFALFEEVIPGGTPKPGDRWRLNLNRLDDAMRVKSQWSQGDRNFPRFHHPEFFGFVDFVKE